MPNVSKRNNVLFIGIDKVALATTIRVTPSYVRQTLRGKRNNPTQIEKITRVIERDLQRLKLESLDAKQLLKSLIEKGGH